jgi:acyl carrier protein phosphodiesterase
MNYLAHLFLSGRTPESLLGNFLGDFVKGSIEHLYTDEIRKGIDLHRKVDIYTDSHPMFCSSKSKIDPQLRRFAGILIDVFYDHFLAKNWERYSDITLDNFSESFYQILQDYQEILPESVKLRLPDIIAADLLGSYREIEGIDRALHRISAKLKRPNHLAAGLKDLKANYDSLELDFFAFFPDLMEYATTYRAQFLQLHP